MKFEDAKGKHETPVSLNLLCAEMYIILKYNVIYETKC